MTSDPDVPLRRASVEVLRAEASDERSVLITARLRAGEDPWEFMEELPSVDELVVLMLQADVLEDHPLIPLTPVRSRRILSLIAEHYPSLDHATKSLMSEKNAHRRWHATV